jgi:hypothetical protein
MAKFSDRIGVTSPPKQFQLNSMSDELRISLWNVVVICFPVNYQTNNFRTFLIRLCAVSLKKSITQLPYNEEDCRRYLEEQFFSLKWYEVYNILEDILKFNKNSEVGIEVRGGINSVLKAEFAGYTLLNDEFVPITNQDEINAIIEAQTTPATKGLKNISDHVIKASSLLSKKPNPDYHNSIKESISAVEGVCKLLTGKKSGGITSALTVLSKKVNLHTSLREGYIKIYGYTSDEGGIRHPMLEDNNVGFEEAKYMLVSCSAFVNYILDKTFNNHI